MPRVAVGGTFDPVHDGHLALLKKAFEVAGKEGEVVVALTSDTMARAQRNRPVRDFETRLRNLENIFKREFRVDNFRFEKLHNTYGSAIEDYYDYIVVSPESEPMACQINVIRRENDLFPLKIVRIDYQLAEDKHRISSTRIWKGEVDEHGKLMA
ncbi:MAG: phosphopantetheine adenylyltransferase [Methanosarcinales archaeon]|nr:phosphopantetheine adenylyltransferase [Methanosarcinales archaeon]